MKYLKKIAPRLLLLSAALVYPATGFATQADVQLVRYSRIAYELSSCRGTPDTGCMNEPELIKQIENSGIEGDHTSLGKIFKHLYHLEFVASETKPSYLPSRPATPVEAHDWNYLKQLNITTYAAARANFIDSMAWKNQPGEIAHLSESIPKLRRLKREMLEYGDTEAVAIVTVWLASEVDQLNPLEAVSLLEYARHHRSFTEHKRGIEAFYGRTYALRTLIEIYESLTLYKLALPHATELLKQRKRMGASAADYAASINILNGMKRYQDAITLADDAMRVAQKNNSDVEKAIALIVRLSIYTHRQQPGDNDNIVALSNTFSALQWEGFKASDIYNIFTAIVAGVTKNSQQIEQAVAQYTKAIDKDIEAGLRPFDKKLAKHNNLRRVYELSHNYAAAYKHQKLYDEVRVEHNTSQYTPLVVNSKQALERDIQFIQLQQAEAQSKNQELQLEAEQLRATIFGLSALIFGISSIWLWQRQRSAKRLSDTDTLTKATTRRALYRWINTSLSSRTPNCAVLIDLDHFKKVNDTYGHLTGDEVLKVFSEIALQRVRKIDKFCRFGGEEFLLIAQNIRRHDAEKLVDSLRVALGNHRNWNTSATPFSVNFSAGIVEFRGKPDIDTIIAHCDRLLYMAKANGRATSESSLYDAS